MLYSLARPAGSTQVLRYRGRILPGELAAVYPKTDGTYTVPASPPVGLSFQTVVRFALFDPIEFDTDPLYALPSNVFDDAQPAAAAPHAPYPCLVSALGINASDMALNTQTWAQNLKIHVNSLGPNVYRADAAVCATVAPKIDNGALIVLDTLTSGLGLNSGLPVVCMLLTLKKNEGFLPFDVDLTFEIRHSSIR